MSPVIVTGSFDDLRSRDVRFLEEASRLGPIRLLLWPDTTVARLTGRPPRFSESERLYLLRAIRFVEGAEIGPEMTSANVLCDVGDPRRATWAVRAAEDHPEKREFCRRLGMDLRIVPEEALAGFPVPADLRPASSARKRVMVSGCYDWLHSGHVRFFEEASAYGELIVSVGRDAVLRELKGPGRPRFGQDERRYMVGAVGHVAGTVFGSGEGWLDAGPEIEALKPAALIVNEDGDRPEKRAFCGARGVDYIALKRLPKEGLPRRDSTSLRGG